jgi:hypothetical protein
VIDKILSGKRWYDRFKGVISGEFVRAKYGDWVNDRQKQIANLLKENEVGQRETVVADWENCFLDEEAGVLRVAGLLATPKDSPHHDKIAGTTLLWDICVDDVSADIEDIKESAKDKLNKLPVNLFMHGHTGSVVDVQEMATAKRKLDLKNGKESIQLSLGLMGAEGACMSAEVGDGETPLLQVEEDLDELTELPDFFSRVGLVWGHSMQGNTVLQMAATMGEKLPNAVFNAVAPVIYGANLDKNKPYESKHVWLHASWRGALVELMPMIHLLPEEPKKRAFQMINKYGVAGVVLGHFVRQKALAAVHFAECEQNPYYLKRVNRMLRKMTDLRDLPSDQLEKLEKMGRQDRVWVTIGKLDTILNPDQMIAFVYDHDLPTSLLKNSGHFPFRDEIEKSVRPPIRNYMGRWG